jgi:uncharacterized protein YecT (DUF1311 family)
MRIAVACVMALACLQIPVQAAEQDSASTTGIDCKTAASTPAVELCASRDYRAADLRLNEVYRAVVASIDKADVPSEARAKWHNALVEAQRRWTAFRDAECALTGYEWYGGTGRAGAETTCMTQLTKGRIEALQLHANSQ